MWVDSNFSLVPLSPTNYAGRGLIYQFRRRLFQLAGALDVLRSINGGVMPGPIHIDGVEPGDFAFDVE